MFIQEVNRIEEAIEIFKATGQQKFNVTLIGNIYVYWHAGKVEYVKGLSLF